MKQLTNDEILWAIDLAITYSREPISEARLASIRERFLYVVELSKKGSHAKRLIESPPSDRSDWTDEQWAEAIWQAYPRKIGGKKKCIPIIIRGFEDMEPWDMVEHVKAYARSQRFTERKYISHPSTYFNQGRYEDDIEEPEHEAPQQPQRPAL